MPRVLIVDDNDANLYLLKSLLAGHGYTVDQAIHGAAAMAIARAHPPDLIVSDLLMPVVDGYTLLRQWRGDEKLRLIPFIVYTATYTEPRDEQLAIAMGADAFIIKPAEPEEILKLVERVLSEMKGGTLPSARERAMDEHVLLRKYNEVLVHKIEKKAMELEEINRNLMEEVSERKRTEAALRESEERYRNLFHSITDPIFVYDVETLGYLSVNAAALARYGYTEEEFFRMTIRDIRPPEEVPALLEMLDHAGSGLENRGVWRHQRKDGSIIDVEISTHGMLFDGRPACVVLARDVTLRLQAEREAERTGNLLRAVADGTPDAVFVKDRGGVYLLFNEAACGFVGKPADFVLGKTDRELFGPEDAETIQTNDRRVMESNSVQTNEENLHTAIGPRSFLATKIPYRDADGAVIGLIGVSRDITEFKSLQDQFRQAQKMEAIGRLAGGVAHDFNNLLTIISGYSDMLNAMPGVSDEDRASIEAIREAGRRAAMLTRQLLGFSRRTVLQPEVLDLNAVVIETGEMLRRIIGEDILFVTALAPTLNRVRVDPGQLNQILMNLAVNARDAMPKGGKLTVETKNVDLTEEYVSAHFDCVPGHYVMLAISDTGCGMTKDVLNRIFEPFFTTKEVGKGTGLGLAMVYGIVQQSGGIIHVYSEPGAGTGFRIYFPAVEDAAPVKDALKVKGDPSGSETILLVEDEEAVRVMAMRSLSMHGYNVIAASDGRDALAIAQSHAAPIDLVLTDVIMPNMGGPELVENVRALFPDMQVIFTSGYTDDAVFRHGLLEANIHFIQKPYSPFGLAQKVRQILDSYQADRP